MIKLYTPENEVEMAMLRSLFEEADIPCFVFNEHFSKNYPGFSISNVSAQTICVHEDDLEQAREILSGYLELEQTADTSASAAFSLWQKIRAALGVVFGLAIPAAPRQNQRSNHRKE